MPPRCKRFLAVLLAMVLAIAAGPAVRAAERPAALSASCDECCAYAAKGERCSTLAVCAPASLAQNLDDETRDKPVGAWCAGIVKAAYVPVAADDSPVVPERSSLGPPPYLSFCSFLL